MLNKDSLARSVVGRTGSFLGALIRLLLYFPEIIRISIDLKLRNMFAYQPQ